MTTNGSEGNYRRSYSLADIARKLNRPRTTIQAWRDQFKPYLPTVSGSTGRATRYEIEALTLFELIARMKDDNEPPEMIEKALKENVNFIIVDEADDEDEEPFMLQMMNGFKSIVEHNAQLVAALEEQRNEYTNLKNAVTTLQQEQEQAQAELLAQQEQKHTELLQRIDQQQRYIDNGLKARDTQLLSAIRQMQEAQQQAAAAAKKRKGVFSMFSKD